MEPTYYNTNDESGAVLEASRQMVKGQESEILALFRRFPDRARTSRQLQAVFGFERTSVTRSLTNLTAAGYLEKSERADVRCQWTGKQVHTWRLMRPKPQKPPVQETLW